MGDWRIRSLAQTKTEYEAFLGERSNLLTVQEALKGDVTPEQVLTALQHTTYLRTMCDL